jgi:hypothetical protein
MSNIRNAVKLLKKPDSDIGEILIKFYETMKALEAHSERAGKQATKIVMTINDIKELF